MTIKPKDAFIVIAVVIAVGVGLKWLRDKKQAEAAKTT